MPIARPPRKATRGSEGEVPRDRLVIRLHMRHAACSWRRSDLRERPPGTSRQRVRGGPAPLRPEARQIPAETWTVWRARAIRAADQHACRMTRCSAGGAPRVQGGPRRRPRIRSRRSRRHRGAAVPQRVACGAVRIESTIFPRAAAASSGRKSDQPCRHSRHIAHRPPECPTGLARWESVCRERNGGPRRLTAVRPRTMLDMRHAAWAARVGIRECGSRGAPAPMGRHQSIWVRHAGTF